MSLGVLIIPEDFRKDEFVLGPIIKRLFKYLKVKARVEICRDPLLGGVGEALKWSRISEILDDSRSMVDLFLLIVDRDGEENRRQQLTTLETKAADLLNGNGCLIAENAWQEIEVWALAGMKDLPSDWSWSDVRNDRDPKEVYFRPYVQQRGLAASAGEGRDVLAREAANRYTRVRARCAKDVQRLEKRIALTLESGACP
jgi:hypothetical protein